MFHVAFIDTVILVDLDVKLLLIDLMLWWDRVLSSIDIHFNMQKVHVLLNE